jgi:hypothetical protein
MIGQIWQEDPFNMAMFSVVTKCEIRCPALLGKKFYSE